MTASKISNPRPENNAMLIKSLAAWYGAQLAATGVSVSLVADSWEI